MKLNILRKSALCVLFINTILTANAQIKLGDNVNTINASSLLELESTTKGLLFTRMTSIQMNTAAGVKGLVIFNTDSNCLFNYTGTSWVSLCRINTIQTLNISSGKGTIWLSNGGGIIKIDTTAAGTNAWLTSGNAITSSATKALGTTNNTDLVMRTNNTERMRIDSATGNVGIATRTPLTTMSIYGGLSIGKCDSVSVTADNQNVTVGNNSSLFFKSNNSSASARTIILSDGLVMGQILILINIDRDASDGIEVPDDINTKLSGNFDLLSGDSLVLMWNGLDWIELSESDN